MSDDVIVRVENLGKKYRIRHQRPERYTALRDVIAERAGRLFRPRSDNPSDPPAIEDFWALQDVSFEIRRGEVLGIIGRNGAGKSTLLKLLSRITEPTVGRIELDGRVASLLEVGTGFHPELSGRENIYLNGAILGMSRVEIQRKFDEIVAFAEVEKFLDTPVKRYSSGMYVRLAFSVAAHLETDILLVDEVLAVGDQEFQKKCLGKMHDVAARQGRTILLVSHNLAAVGEMAQRALLLDGGRIAVDGTVTDAVSTYLSKGQKEAIYLRPQERPTRAPHISKAQIFTSDPNGIHRFGEPLKVKFWIQHEKPMQRGCLFLQLINYNQQPIVHAWALYPKVRFGSHEGESVLECTFPSLRLNVGKFHMRTYLAEPPGGEVYEMLDGICPIEVVRTDEARAWDWRPEDCAYHEQWYWEDKCHAG
jgi:lipopolysaccharide transport system ATP-binding protein